MKKTKNKKQPIQKKQVQDDSNLTLKDRLNSDLMSKLQAAKNELLAEEQRKQEEIQAQKEFDRKQREKNKTFEELLNESSFDWKNYK